MLDSTINLFASLEGKLLMIVIPVSGASHDAYAFKAHELGRYLDETILADKGYVGLGPATRDGVARIEDTCGCEGGEQVHNKSRRVVVEQVTAQPNAETVAAIEEGRHLLRDDSAETFESVSELRAALGS